MMFNNLNIWEIVGLFLLYQLYQATINIYKVNLILHMIMFKN